MQIQVDIAFDDLVRIVKRLPKDQLIQFKKELEKQEPGNQRQEMESFLLQAPKFTAEQLDQIAEARKSINEWRTN